MATITVTDEHIIGSMAKENKPASYCRSGDTVIFLTKDCYGGSVTCKERPNGDFVNPVPNPATGPVYIEEAKPGDILKVDIISIEVNPTGAMRSSLTAVACHEKDTERSARIYDLGEDQIVFDENLVLKTDPMIGVIGTAPAGEPVDTETPGSHGGNMDVRRINAGTILYLPVNTDGALLAMGDVHALMGDGEVFICGLETGAKITVRVTVIKNRKLPLPLIVNEDTVAAIASSESLDQAALDASNMMFDLFKEGTALSDFEIGMLLSLKGNLVICQIVNPLKTVYMEIDRGILRIYHIDL